MFISLQSILAQLFLGLVNGSFYAILSLGLAIIFGLLNVKNFAHGAFFMLGAVFCWMGANYFSLNYWVMLIAGPLAVGFIGVLVEIFLLRRIYKLDYLYGLILTLGLTLLIQGIMMSVYGVAGLPYSVPSALASATDLGFMIIPNYRMWVVFISMVVCLSTWVMIERTALGARLRAATENAKLVGAFGINVPLTVTLTYGFGVALAGFAGVLAAPIMHVTPLMAQDLIIVVFAIVVIGGIGSILGSVVTGLILGVVEAMTKLFYPEASSTVVFLLMALVLIVRPAGLFGVAK